MGTPACERAAALERKGLNKGSVKSRKRAEPYFKRAEAGVEAV
jgi:hypothetical protein